MRNILVGLAILLVAGTSFAGRVGGPVSKRDTVSANQSDTYNLVFREKEGASVLVNGDGSSDLDCYAYDSGGNEVASDTDSTDTCLLLWTPLWTGKFRIVIRNMGDADNEYSIRTN